MLIKGLKITGIAFVNGLMFALLGGLFYLLNIEIVSFIFFGCAIFSPTIGYGYWVTLSIKELCKKRLEQENLQNFIKWVQTKDTILNGKKP